ncbi:sensor histidine kinase [Paenibacillus sp. GXUN7292]|uniref:sensor histidine kinase n=1 Tax=Paenibacillus sp. GXUN7292 TaxID=3422499 RepID=UPI003D7E9FC5
MFPVLKSKKLIMIWVGAVIFAVHLWLSFVSYHYMYLGVEVSTTDSDKWIISKFHSGSAANIIGLELYDEVLRIDGRPVMQHFSVPKFHSIEQARSVEVLRDNSIYEFTLYDVESPNTMQPLLLNAIELIMFIVAAALYTRAVYSASTKLLILLFVLMGFIFMSIEASSRGDAIAIYLIFNALSIVPVLFVHFMYRLLEEKGQSFFPFMLIKVLYYMLIPISLARLVYFTPLANYKYYSFDRFFSLLFFTTVCILSLVFLIFLYFKRRYEYSYSANIIKTMFFAFGISFTPILLLSIIPDLFGVTGVSYSNTIWALILFPIFFFYFASRKKLFNFKWSGIEKMLIQFFSTLTHRSNPTTLAMHQIIRNFKKIQQLEDLRTFFLPELCRVLKVKHAAVCINYYSHFNFFSHGDIDKEHLKQILQNDSESTIASEYLIFDIEQNADYSGYLIIKYPNRSLLAACQQWLETLCGPLSLVIENIHLSKKLSMRVTNYINEAAAASEQPLAASQWINKLTFQLQEMERARIASDLHDTVLQDIFFARQRVVKIQEKKLNANEINIYLQELTEFLDIININAREAAFLLYPHQLKEAGFAVAISNLIETERGIAPYKLRLKIEHSKKWDALPSDILLQLFRISQELLSNAKKHSKAHNVSLHFYKTDYQYCLHYSDNGVGISEHKHEDTMGWIGIRQRVANIDASIEVKTASGRGLSVLIILAEE